MITHFKGNRSPSLTDIITVDGSVFDLTGSTVKLKMRPIDSPTLKVDTAAVVVSAAAGTVRYDWAALDVDTAGRYMLWWEVTLPTAKVQETPATVLVMLDHAPSAVVNYIDREELKETLTLSGETYPDADIDAAIVTASRAVDDYCGRRFYPDADATQVRYYTPMSCNYLYVDDMLTLTTLKTDDDGDGTFESTWTQNTHFVLEPLNATANGRPWGTVRVLPSASLRFAFRPRSVELTGKFGWSTPPAGVIQATTIWAAALLRTAREGSMGVITVGLEAGAIARLPMIPPAVRMLLGPFVRGPFVA